MPPKIVATEADFSLMIDLFLCKDDIGEFIIGHLKLMAFYSLTVKLPVLLLYKAMNV